MTMQAFSCIGKELQLNGATIVLPAVTHANVGELAMDILISSLARVGLQLAARLENPNCMPVVGNDAYSLDQPGTLSTAMELYHLQGTTTYFLQQRAPAIKGLQAEFAASFAEWLQQQGVKHVIVLCGLDALTRKDRLIMGTPARFLSFDDKLKDLCASGLGLPALEEDYLEEEKQLHGRLPPWPLLGACQQRNVSTMLLTSFVTEGDNQADGMALAWHTLQLLLLHTPSGVKDHLDKAGAAPNIQLSALLLGSIVWTITGTWNAGLSSAASASMPKHYDERANVMKEGD